jgi:hypothetical protein
VTNFSPNIRRSLNGSRDIHIANYQALLDLSLNPIDAVQPPPATGLLVGRIFLTLLGLRPIGITVGRNDNDCEFSVGENRPAIVEEIVGSEFHSRAHNPAERAEVVIHHIGYHERVIDFKLRRIGAGRIVGMMTEKGEKR